MGIKMQMLAEEVRKEDLKQQQTIQEQAQELIRLKERLEFMQERLQWLKRAPSGNSLTEWQQLVIQEAVQGYPGVSARDLITPLPSGSIADRLRAYFNKRAKENRRRSEKLENRSHTFQRLDQLSQDERSSYYFSGKAEAYENAARKVVEIINEK